MPTPHKRVTSESHTPAFQVSKQSRHQQMIWTGPSDIGKDNTDPIARSRHLAQRRRADRMRQSSTTAFCGSGSGSANRDATTVACALAGILNATVDLPCGTRYLGFMGH